MFHILKNIHELLGRLGDGNVLEPRPEPKG